MCGLGRALFGLKERISKLLHRKNDLFVPKMKSYFYFLMCLFSRLWGRSPGRRAMLMQMNLLRILLICSANENGVRILWCEKGDGFFDGFGVPQWPYLYLYLLTFWPVVWPIFLASASINLGRKTFFFLPQRFFLFSSSSISPSLWYFFSFAVDGRAPLWAWSQTHFEPFAKIKIKWELCKYSI